jgi:hypothetical protein
VNIARFALLLPPSEVSEMVPGWPEDAYLVLRSDAGGLRWQCGPEAAITAMLHGYPVWPPVAGIQVSPVDAIDEADLVRRFTALPGVAAAASAMMCPAIGGLMPGGIGDEDEIDWS